MAQYYHDFADGLTGWTERYNVGGTFSQSSGVVTLDSGQFNDWRVLSWDTIDSDSNRATVEIRRSPRP